ncbi:S49 family peptidase [Hymenobacter pini]|uniref:S49 family peptidase n=1 Tax=Hymenobacter pini TaxID=2880879 RepID=UPI001CF5B597|nr:S49 family peptidase [Hymenobacter pini]MCA8831952.1 S49 family peptidase [Hymenobacter pini]
MSAILRSPWAIQSETVLGYLPQIAAMLKGEQPAATTAPAAPAEPGVLFAAAKGGGRSSARKFDDSPDGVVAVHQLKGVMMKQDQIGLCTDVPGTASLLRAMQAADRHDNVVGHLLDIDSGGGAVDGTAEFAAGIAALTKPIVAYTDGLIGSAAVWAAVSCAEIYLNNETCRIGSIGVMASIQDIKPALQKLGVNFHDLVADGSEDKNADFFSVLAGDYEPYKANVLNPLRALFHEHVKASLGEQLNPKTSEKALKGGMFFASEAKEMGLITGIGSFDFAVQRVLDLAAEAPAPADGAADQANHSNSTNMSFLKRFPAVAALAGLTGTAVTAGLLDAANAELEAANIQGAGIISTDALAAFEAQATELASIKATLTEAGVDSVAALVTARDEAVAQAAEYGDQPGAVPTSSTKEKSDVEEDGDNPQSVVDSLHEKMLNS